MAIQDKNRCVSTRVIFMSYGSVQNKEKSAGGILDVGVGWRGGGEGGTVSTPLHLRLYPPGKQPDPTFHKIMEGPSKGINIFRKRNFFLLPGIESRFHGRPGHRPGPV